MRFFHHNSKLFLFCLAASLNANVLAQDRACSDGFPPIFGLCANDLSKKPEKSEPPPPPKVSSESFETQSKKVVTRYWLEWSSDNEKAMKMQNEILSDKVVFFNTIRSKTYILKEKSALVNRWPLRLYKERESSLSTSCNNEKKVCTIKGIADWSADSPSRNTHASGVMEFEFQIDFSLAQEKIIAESSKNLEKS